MTSKNMTLNGQGLAHAENNQEPILVQHKESRKKNYAEMIPLTMGTINGKAAMVTDARNLHKFLGNKELFANWIKQRIEQYGFIENEDYETYLENSKKGRPRTEYRVSSDMAKELSMVERTEEGKEARQYFIDCEKRLRRVAPEEHQAALVNWRKNRVAACEDHKSMADAMKGYIERTGDNQKGFAYSNESRFINKLVLGIDPVRWAKNKGIKSKEVRDNMTVDQLQLLAYLESRNCAFLDLDTPTETRKAQLTELAQRWLAQRMESKQ
ncbi:antA/AntB antirepressor family protein [Xenorhabdus hominickii]|uniref:Anti-repressor protein n=2 Tax=Xenorhabdus hominickii TaxID=351679 RepID=A0ABN4S315_XENHO|nr:antA/AntB antirepressor family protein [Xenorhabdus hominickii]AOM39205.1 anti-repressor protein [Xenorhabdus hominickii]